MPKSVAGAAQVRYPLPLAARRGDPSESFQAPWHVQRIADCLVQPDAFGEQRLGAVDIAIGQFHAAEPKRQDALAPTILSTAIGLATTVAGVGFLLTGITVLRAGRWQGWHRLSPLLCGLVVFVVAVPVLVVDGEQFLWAVATWSACFILLGAALYQRHRAPELSRLSAARAP